MPVTGFLSTLIWLQLCCQTMQFSLQEAISMHGNSKRENGYICHFWSVHHLDIISYVSRPSHAGEIQIITPLPYKFYLNGYTATAATTKYSRVA